jgi:uracil-DNA glycosylase
MASTILSEYRELYEAIYHCTLCKEYGYYVERVQPKWDPSKVHRTTIRRWGMLIGQAPGKSELRKRKAFQGRAGGELGKWLRAGFSEEEIIEQVNPQLYKTSVTKCYPGKHGRNDRKPTKKEVGLCASFLQRQIHLVRPRVLIPMGMAAINWFFPEVKRLEEVVGQNRFWRQGSSDYAVICLPHPSPGSRWLNVETNRELLRSALRLLSDLWTNAFHRNRVQTE